MPGKIFNYRMQILEWHLDTFGHVNNAVYLSIFEQARWDFVTARGYGLAQIHERHIGPTILDVTMKFKKEIKLRDVIDIESQTLSYEKQFFKVAQKILRNNEICCVAEFTMALFDLQQRKIVMPIPEWVHAIGMDETD